ncbi:MAG: hypothetical protein JRC53_03440 [Deltaproteobacteria bacterium]|nr:hypothetical protein [Deltaproteobacteria bacterium]
MKNDTPANPLEMLAYFISLQIEDCKVVYVGTGLPMVASHTGAQDPRPQYHDGI